MLIINLLAIAAAIQKSALLTAPERAYWTARLSIMTSEQLARLDRVLKKAENLHWTERALRYVASLTGAAALHHA